LNYEIDKKYLDKYLNSSGKIILNNKNIISSNPADSNFILSEGQTFYTNNSPKEKKKNF